jgi:hypothetical protein
MYTAAQGKFLYLIYSFIYSWSHRNCLFEIISEGDLPALLVKEDLGDLHAVVQATG